MNLPLAREDKSSVRMNFLICLIVLCTVYNAKTFGGSGSGGSGGIESFIKFVLISINIHHSNDGNCVDTFMDFVCCFSSVFGIKTMAIGFKQNIVNQKFDKFKRGLSSFQQPTMPIATGLLIDAKFWQSTGL